MWYGYHRITKAAGISPEDVASIKAVYVPLDTDADHVTSVRLSLDGTKAIIECYHADTPTAEDFACDDFALFTGDSHEARRSACVAYIAANAAEWQTPEE